MPIQCARLIPGRPQAVDQADRGHLGAAPWIRGDEIRYVSPHL
ncbi:hypothetical protein Ae168Ps1_0035c [Pseudonocardia sp. Ae168_Ps1]|nr:hypothetical protein Ae150APs1_0035c [Pseudonocardia sp. Ae150A_Ps1]OLL77629.1 hypothetical protein Ae168Ps1_0035c [Pseudonocardia sp. Ae168_Ps1]OLL88252.1 hypothetical protein Ae263Ps1_5307 [Pseudonocardia sp. Ae263_Ps1]OLL91723.1 hypothetical protein Ae356Ps1_1620c [Pseudonocardia sp. Ae356_Ps1]